MIRDRIGRHELVKTMTNLRKRLDITDAFLYKKETTVNSTVDTCLCKCTMRVMCARCCVIFTRQQHAHMTRIVHLHRQVSTVVLYRQITSMTDTLSYRCSIMFQNCVKVTTSNGNRTECSPIRSVIIRVITKSVNCVAGVRFVYHECDYGQNIGRHKVIQITISEKEKNY